jgi:selenocysteine lyase/cysteine desulfurase
LDVHTLREQFPALRRKRGGLTPVFFDGPGGTQVPQCVIDFVADYLATCNANHGGLFDTSRESDRVLRAAHEAVADLLNAPAYRGNARSIRDDIAAQPSPETLVPLLESLP